MYVNLYIYIYIWSLYMWNRTFSYSSFEKHSYIRIPISIYIKRSNKGKSDLNPFFSFILSLTTFFSICNLFIFIYSFIYFFFFLWLRTSKLLVTTEKNNLNPDGVWRLLQEKSEVPRQDYLHLDQKALIAILLAFALLASFAVLEELGLSVLLPLRAEFDALLQIFLL